MKKWFVYYTYKGSINDQYLRKVFSSKEKANNFIKTHIGLKEYHNFRLSEVEENND